MRALLLFFLLLAARADGACHTCVFSPLPVASRMGALPMKIPPPLLPSGTHTLVPLGIILANQAAFMVIQRRMHRQLVVLRSSNNDEDNAEGLESDDTPRPVSSAMVGAIGFYKTFISPLLPPACRFLPTCSQYGVQAIEEFGPTKGAILTAWRLLRCSPFGGKGYDPPRWPPVHYTYGSY